MSFNGKIIGPKNLPEFFRGNGIWNLNASACTWLELGRWYFNRSAIVNKTSVVEGDTFVVTINTVGVPDGTLIFWTTNTISGTITTADFVGLDLTGYVRIINNTATVTRKMRWTTATSGQRQFTIAFRVESVEGPIVASSPVITTNDYASGGTSSFVRGSYFVHRFGSSGIFTAAKTITANVFLVAGGGGGGDTGGGGGGAGGVRQTTVTIPAGARWVYIGGGGGTNAVGGYTTIDGVIDTPGGGGGGQGYGAGPQGGGSGGGGSFSQGGAGGTAGQGNGGGSGNNDATAYQGIAYVYSAGGGGGGIGGGGGNGSRSGYAATGGVGGPGANFDPGLDGTPEPYGGGGGGARYYYGTNGTDGVGQGPNRGGGGKGGGGRPGFYTAPMPGDTGVCYISYLYPT
jgi:hypothetical protein